MTQGEFEKILDKVRTVVMKEFVAKKKFRSEKFEEITTKALCSLTYQKHIQASNCDGWNAVGSQGKFPDFDNGEFGVEIKYTDSNTWKHDGNSFIESKRPKGLKAIYVFFGKSKPVPEIKWDLYSKVVVGVVRRDEYRSFLDMNAKASDSYFYKKGITYENFSKLPPKEKKDILRGIARVEPTSQELLIAILKGAVKRGKDAELKLKNLMSNPEFSKLNQSYFPIE
jgi:hypothetical protein